MVLNANHIKCVVIGDDSVGKTSMLVSYATKRFPTTCVPSAFDNYAGLISLSGKQHHLQLFDTIEEEASIDIIGTSFSDADVFVLCYSAVQPKSFQNVKEKWLPKIRYYFGKIPLILVATQTDLRDDQTIVSQLEKEGLKPVTRNEGCAFSKLIGCESYIECSPNMERKLKHVMNKAISTVLLPQTDKVEMQTCSIL